MRHTLLYVIGNLRTSRFRKIRLRSAPSSRTVEESTHPRGRLVSPILQGFVLQLLYILQVLFVRKFRQIYASNPLSPIHIRTDIWPFSGFQILYFPPIYKGVSGGLMHGVMQDRMMVFAGKSMDVERIDKILCK